MNWAQFKDPDSHTCLAGTVVASWSLTQAGLNPFTVMTFNFITEFSETFRKISSNRADFNKISPHIAKMYDSQWPIWI